MPNHCSNDLFITGPASELKRFKEHAQGDEIILDVEKFIPHPKNYRDADEAAEKDRSLKDGYNNGGYDWCIKNWGTKWGAYEISLDETPKKLSYTFDTAWAPMLPVIVKMGEMFPLLKFVNKYYEMGMGCKGSITVKGKTIIHPEDVEYKGNRGG